MDPAHRFSSRVQDYVRYRPSYPAGVLSLLERKCGLTKSSTVADVGSGTGFLSKLLLDFGCRVIGIEPNAEMRAAGDAFLAGYQNFRSVDGRAEQTGLPDAGVDLVTAAQAFHWFDPAAARAEFRRILRQPPWVALIWNERIVTPDGFLRGYEDLLLRYAPDYAKVDHRRIDAERITDFFGHRTWREESFDNSQFFDLTGVRGRLTSSSYAPQEGTSAFEPMMQELERLFAEHQVNGQVPFLYETKVFYGVLGG